MAMAISARCPACGKDYQLTDDQAGQRVRCRVCRWEFEVAGRVETLEAVPVDALAGGRAAPSELFDTIEPPAPRKRRRWRYVLGALALLLLLTFMSCCGVGWVLVLQKDAGLVLFRRQVNAGVAAAREEAKRDAEQGDKPGDPANKDKKKPNKEKDRADKNGDDPRSAKDEVRLGGAGRLRQIAVGGAQGALDDLLAKIKNGLPNVEDLVRQAAEAVVGVVDGAVAKLVDVLEGKNLGPVRDVDDCVARLRSNSRPARVSALKWIGEKQYFADLQQRKKIIDALGAAMDDPLLKDKIVFWKLALELDP
jgi:hypothetical protein